MDHLFIYSKNIPLMLLSTLCGRYGRSNGVISHRRLTPGATYRCSPSPKRSAVYTQRNTNTAQSFLRGRGSSKSVPDSPVDSATLSRWDTPLLIKTTDCTVCWGELPQTDTHCEPRLCGCVWNGGWGRGGGRWWTCKGRNPRHESTCVHL